MSEKQLSFEGAMMIVNGNKWIKLKDIEKLSDFIQEQQATIRSLQNKNIILKNRIEDLKTSIHFQDKELQRLLQQSKGVLKDE